MSYELAVETQPIPPLMEYSRQRALDLPEAIWHCERCETPDSMRLRRSSLNGFGADDILVKCVECKYAAVHGVEVDDGRFEEELEKRKEKYGSRTIDVNKHSDKIEEATDEVEKLLSDLGYR